MKLELLVRGKKATNRCIEASLPEGVRRSVGTYGANEKGLRFVTFYTEGNNLETAIVLADLRDSVFDEKNMRVLKDGASAKLGENLYPLFCEYERGLREVLTIAQCAAQDRFDDDFVRKLENDSDLGKYPGKLFLDHEFSEAVAKLNDDALLSKDELIEKISSLEHKNLWETLFDEGDMPSLRKSFDELRKRRNDVMHFHRIGSETFRATKALLKRVCTEIEQCIAKMHEDVTYPKRTAVRAEAAARIASAYDSMLQNQAARIAAAAAQASGIAQWQSMAAKGLVDVSAFKGMASQISDMGNQNFSNAIAAQLGQVKTAADLVAQSGALAGVRSHISSLATIQVPDSATRALEMVQSESMEKLKRAAMDATQSVNLSKLSAAGATFAQIAKAPGTLSAITQNSASRNTGADETPERDNSTPSDADSKSQNESNEE